MAQGVVQPGVVRVVGAGVGGVRIHGVSLPTGARYAPMQARSFFIA